MIYGTISNSHNKISAVKRLSLSSNYPRERKRHTIRKKDPPLACLQNNPEDKKKTLILLPDNSDLGAALSGVSLVVLAPRNAPDACLLALMLVLLMLNAIRVSRPCIPPLTLGRICDACTVALVAVSRWCLAGADLETTTGQRYDLGLAVLVLV